MAPGEKNLVKFVVLRHSFTGQVTYISLAGLFGIGNHMISGSSWDKSARVNFSKANKIARARRASAIFSL